MGKKLRKLIFTLLITISSLLIGVSYVNAAPGEITLSKSAVKNDVTYGRSATLTLQVNAASFTTVNATDVVLVLDRSSSMNGTKMSETKGAANNLIDLLLTAQTSGNVRVGVVSYGTNVLTSYTSSSLSSSATTLKNLINSIPDTYDGQGTNVHDGLIKANSLLSGSTAKKIVILLSDGEPTYFIGTNGTKLCGSGYSDSYDNSPQCNNSPSAAANTYATTMKNSGVEMFTVGFSVSNPSNAYTFLGNVATDPDSTHLYLASDYSGLTAAFSNMVNNFNIVATNGVVTDIVPAGFNVSGSLPSGATSVLNGDGTTTITWNVGNISSFSPATLSYTIVADENQYGSMYTNVSATLTATSVSGNPCYGSSTPYQ